MRVVVRSLDSEWRPTQGDFYDAVCSALEFAGVPALVVEHGASARGALRGCVTAEQHGERAPCFCCGAYAPDHVEGCAVNDSCAGCGGELGPDGCAVCDACRECCSCGGGDDARC